MALTTYQSPFTTTVSTTEHYESKEKFVNDLYLRTAAINNLQIDAKRKQYSICKVYYSIRLINIFRKSTNRSFVRKVWLLLQHFVSSKPQLLPLQL